MRPHLREVVGGRAADERVVGAIEATELAAVIGEWEKNLVERWWAGGREAKLATGRDEAGELLDGRKGMDR